MHSITDAQGRLLAIAGFNCLAIGSGFYLTQITPVSPIYPLLAIAISLCIFTIGLSKAARVPKTRGVIGWTLACASIHFAGYLAWVSPFNAALGFYLNFLFLGLAWRFLPLLRLRELDNAVVRFINFSILLGVFEATVRYFYPFQIYDESFLQFHYQNNTEFYLYKFNSIMYQDTNFVAMWLLVVAILAFEVLGYRRAGIKIIILCGLVGLTICRSAIFALAIYIFINLIYRYVPFRSLRVIFFSVFALVGFFLLADLVKEDGSFQSKITIYALVVANYLSGVNLQTFLIGLGMSNSLLMLDGISAHNFFVELLIDAGLVGAAYAFFSMFYLASLSGRVGYSIVWTFLVAGMSFAPVTIPYLYVALSMAAFLKVPPKILNATNNNLGGFKYEVQQR